MLFGLAAAIVATLVLLRLAELARNPTASDGLIGRGSPAPAIVGTTLDGVAFDLASLRGRPVIVNFWGPSCVPCRDEFPLFKTKLAEHAAEGLAIVGILMNDPPAPARDFIAELGATWPTVEDPQGVFRTAYRVAALPQSYLIDRDGILREIQVGEFTECDFERKLALAVAPSDSPASAAPSACR